MWRIALFVAIIALVNANASHIYSAVRNQDEPWENARLRHINAFQDLAPQTPNTDKSAYQNSAPLSNASFSIVSKASFSEIQALFDRARDIRFMRDVEHANFSRRTTWLYPDDGCYARAEMLRQHALNWNYAFVPSKIFAFGNLTVKTSNSPSGSVSWWYHVAPIVRSETSNLWVLDPSIHPDAPISLDNWLGAMTNDKNSLKVSACASFAYEYDSSCFNAPLIDNLNERLYYQALIDERSYFDSEWNRQVELDRNPERVLGDYPPWKISATD
jgi:hypothetical protein